MQFDWAKTAWKGVRAGLGVALAAALYAGVGVLLEQFDSPEELAALGLPAVAIPILVALGAMLRNWLKHRKMPKV
jgi:hypothetical protein